MTIPRAAAAFVSVSAPLREPAAKVSGPPAEPRFAAEYKLAAESRPAVESESAVEPVAVPLAPEIKSELPEVEQLAEELLAAGEAARKVTILGTASGESITLTALTMARLLARKARVVVVDLAAASPTISAVSVDPNAPGLAEMMQGEASFIASHHQRTGCRGPILSVPDGPGSDRTLLQSPRIGACDRCAC